MLIVWPAAGQATQAQEPDAIPAEEFVGIMAGDEAADLADLTVEGDLDLRSLRQVVRPFRCQRCRFTGAVVATDLIFERIVDVRGSVFEGPTDLSAAIFEDRAGFEDSQFEGPATFGLTRFLAGASFAGSEFGEAAVFERAQFGDDAVFSNANFASGADFEAARFNETAEFAGAGFAADGNFAAADFTERASFVRADFAGTANFRGATMAAGANLGVNEFAGDLMLAGVTAGGSIEFPGAVLYEDGFFVNLSSTGTLVLEEMLLHPDAELLMDRIGADGLTMDVERQIDFVQGTLVKERVLELVERTGRESGDLALANRARFQLMDLQGERKEGLDRAVDRLVFRDVGGYLVRPLNPIRALLLLILTGGLIRSARSLGESVRGWRQAGMLRRGSASPRQLLHRVLLMLEKATARVLAGIAATMKVAVKPKADHIKLGDPERTREYLKVGVLWCEFLVYKLVFAAIVLTLGNSNPTIRQLLDAVTG
ncbi:MAG: pentapeptide repeat-containing protein [Actinobacteria bacterium]|nr:pentapeptide repeat-containing protein [Actinomycetota bacterium]